MELKKIEVSDEVLQTPDEWSVKYNYNYGRLSPFFRALKEDGKLLATRCPKCGHVSCPPKPDCSECFVSADWVETTGEGTIDVFSISHFKVAGVAKEPPYCLANIKMDGTDTSILASVTGIDLDKIKIGMRVKIRFIDKDKREGKVTDFEFVPI